MRSPAMTRYPPYVALEQAMIRTFEVMKQKELLLYDFHISKADTWAAIWVFFVNDEDTFLAFVAALEEDRRRNAEREEWQNDSIEDFLEAASAWAKDSRFGAKQGLAPASPWKKFAVFLYCGKIYE